MMITLIEEAIQSRVEDNLSSVRDVQISKTGRGLVNPTVYVSIEEGTFKKRGQISFEQSVNIYIEVEFKNMKEADRKKGAFLVLEGIVGTLTLQKFDLSIDPLKPQRWQNVTSEKDATAGKARYMLIMSTAYTIEAVDDEVVTDLLTVGLSYFLQDPADDDVQDAEDIVDLPQT